LSHIIVFGRRVQSLNIKKIEFGGVFNVMLKLMKQEKIKKWLVERFLILVQFLIKNYG